MANVSTTNRNDTANIKQFTFCEVYWEGFERIVCEGFKFSLKMKADTKNDCGQMNPYGYTFSDFEYEWELTEPAENDLFDKRYFEQVYDPHGLTIINNNNFNTTKI
jgi:hypothetical protein